MKQHEHSSLAERLACPSCLRSTAPAADAGPRQGHKHECGIDFKHEVCACVDCGATKPIERPWNEADAAPRWDEICANCGSVYGHHFGTKCPKPHQTHWESTPPVPQEAAPRKHGEFVELLRTEMMQRFSNALSMEQIAEFSYAVAALIREAGSEREREWRDEIAFLKQLERSTSPCGHLARYAKSDDGGKHITCLECELLRLQTVEFRLPCAFWEGES